MILRDLPAALEAALMRMMQKPEAKRPCLVVDALPKSGKFIQYYGSVDRPLVLQVVYNVDTREIPRFEDAAKRFFGGDMVIDEDERFGLWDRECPSVVRAVEHGMYVLRHVLLLDWGQELAITELEDEAVDRVRRWLVFGGLQ